MKCCQKKIPKTVEEIETFMNTKDSHSGGDFAHNELDKIVIEYLSVLGYNKCV